MVVSSTSPVYPPKIGICSIMMISPEAPHAASMLRPDISIFNSFNWEHSWASNGFKPCLVRSDAIRPAADNGVSGPYMHMPGRCDRRVASRTFLISDIVALISQGVLVVA